MPRCRYCKELFKSANSLNRFCSVEHALAYLETEEGSEKFNKVKAKKRRERHRARKDAIKKRSEWIADLQKAFNKFIRLRDADLPCISCGKTNEEAGERFSGGVWDAGHYRSIGSCPAHRFTEKNVAKQCKKCNQFQSGRAVEFRIELIKRIGLKAVEELEVDPPPLKLTIQEIKDLIKVYREKARELEREEK